MHTKSLVPLALGCGWLAAQTSGALSGEAVQQHQEQPHPPAESAGEYAKAVTLSPADTRLLDWLDTLKLLPDLATRKFVHVCRSPDKHASLGADCADGLDGWLMEEANDHFTVLLLNLSSLRFPRPPIATEPMAPDIIIVPLQDQAASILRRCKQRQRQDSYLRVELAVLASACAKKGFAQLAHDVLACAAAVLDVRTGKHPRVEDLPKLLSEELAELVFCREVQALCAASNGRAEMERRFRQFVRNFPGTRHEGEAQAMAERLARMCKEDEEHSGSTGRRLDRMSTSEQVVELIYQLRDQNAHQIFSHGGCNIFMDPRDIPARGHQAVGSPASRLVAIGFSAVPQLMAHIDDHTLTRCYGVGRIGQSLYVLEVGDCVVQIVERIAGMSDGRNSLMISTAQRRARVKDWWSKRVRNRPETP
jgi:hypothetical protein